MNQERATCAVSQILEQEIRRLNFLFRAIIHDARTRRYEGIHKHQKDQIRFDRIRAYCFGAKDSKAGVLHDSTQKGLSLLSVLSSSKK